MRKIIIAVALPVLFALTGCGALKGLKKGGCDCPKFGKIDNKAVEMHAHANAQQVQ